MTTFHRDENDILHIGNDCFLELPTLHSVIRRGHMLDLYFCSCHSMIELPNEDEARKIYNYLLTEKAAYLYRRKLASEAQEKRNSYAVQINADMLKEMKR